jgi:hypothetical protein
MQSSSPAAHLARQLDQGLVLSVLALFVCACTTNDYKMDGNGDGHGGAASTSSVPPSGGTNAGRTSNTGIAGDSALGGYSSGVAGANPVGGVSSSVGAGGVGSTGQGGNTTFSGTTESGGNGTVGGTGVGGTTGEGASGGRGSSATGPAGASGMSTAGHGGLAGSGPGTAGTSGANPGLGGATAAGTTAAGTTAGSGGAAGFGGTTVTGGTSSGGAAAAAGYSGKTGAMTCSGCARLDVPFTARDQLARYYMMLSSTATVNEHASGGAAGASAVTNAGTMKIRAYAPLLGNTNYEMLIQQSVSPYAICYSAVQTLPDAITSSWVTLEWSLASCSTDASIGRLGLDLITSSATSAPSPSTTTMWLDSIWIELKGEVILGPYNFDTATSVNPSTIANDYEQTANVLYLRPTISTPPVGSTAPPSGSTVSWFSN